MIAFVDEYWKIIHRAAGWDALRYWLLVSFFLEIFLFFIFIWNKTENRSLILPSFSFIWPLFLFLFLFFRCYSQIDS